MLELLNGREHFFQWDTNQKVKIDDNEVLVVQYDNGTGEALVCPVYEFEGQRVADVPNIMLQMPIVIKAYAACEDCVRYARAYKVEQRSRPDDYVYEETETVKYSTLLAMIEEAKADLDTFISEAAATDELLLEKLEADTKQIESKIDSYNTTLNNKVSTLETKYNNELNTVKANHTALVNNVAENRGKIAVCETTISSIRNKDLPYIEGQINTVSNKANSNESRIVVLENKPAVNTELEERVAANTERIEALEESGGTGTGGSGSGCECRRQLNIVLKRNGYGITEEFSIPVLELLSMTQEEINMLDISVMFDEAYWIVDSCVVGNDCIDIQMSYMYIAGDNNGTLTRYHITIYKDDTKEKGYFITEATAGRYNLYHLPNPQNGGGRQYLVAENNSYKLVDDVGTGGGSDEEETPQTMMLKIIEQDGVLTIEEMPGMPPAYIIENLGIEQMLAIIFGVQSMTNMAYEFYKAASISLVDMSVILANGIKQIHWAADGSLSYITA